jgi:predicted enzyme related to lactoylglutathione lyase
MPGMADWITIFLDTPAHDLDDAVCFWSAVTGWSPSTRRGESAQFLTLEPATGPAWVKLQAVDGPARVHLDLDSDDRPAAVARAQQLGATHAWTYEDVEVVRSPGGLLLCHTLWHSAADGEPRLVRDGRTIIDQVCIDIPQVWWETELEFWAALTQRPLEPSGGGYARLDTEGHPRILLQRLGEADGAVRAHPDLASADRADDVRRHVGWGARLVATHDRWSVLEAPGGQVYCVTDRDPRTGLLPY